MAFKPPNSIDASAPDAQKWDLTASSGGQNKRHKGTVPVIYELMSRRDDMSVVTILVHGRVNTVLRRRVSFPGTRTEDFLHK